MSVRGSLRQVARHGYRALGRLGHALLDEPSNHTALTPEPRPDPRTPPWLPLPDLHQPRSVPHRVLCNICRWEGEAFLGRQHVEFAHCPACGSSGRDRFLHWCLTQRVELHPALRVIELSPRLGPAYQAAMRSWFFYRTSDYDRQSHRGDIQLDLQAIDLPDDCLDVVLCAHVLEHVADTGKALAELHRVIAPGGHLLLQVPILQGHTAPPPEPEVHEDDVPVFWRFGFDLTATLRDHGFQTDLLCSTAFARTVASGEDPWPRPAAEFDVPDILATARTVPTDLTPVVDDGEARTLGLEPAYMFLTWDCVVPG